MATKKNAICVVCGTAFLARKGAKTCSPTCRKRLQRHNQTRLVDKAVRLESELGQEFQRLSAELFHKHVLLPALSPSDERGSIMVSEADSDLETAPVANPDSQPPIEQSSPPARGLSTLFRLNGKALLFTGGLLLIIALIGISSFFIFGRQAANRTANSIGQKVANFPVSNLSLTNLGAQPSLTIGQASQVVINGQLKVTNSLVLVPSSTPTAPVSGQIYFNQANNTPYYYNGSQFVSLAPTTSQPVTTIGGVAGAITLGSGLQITGSQLALTNFISNPITSAVTSLNNLSGTVTLADTSSSGNTLTINTASTNQLGLAEFNANDFTAVNGVVDTIQNIGTAATVQFGSLTLTTGDLTLPAGATLHADNIVNSGAGNNLSLSGGNNNIVFSNEGGSNTFAFPTTGGAGQTICTTGITCASGGGAAVILEPNSAQSASGNLNSIFINKTGGSGNIIDLQVSGNNEFTVSNTGSATFGSNLTVQGSSLTLGVPGSVAGNLNLANASSGRQVVLQGLNPSGIGNATVQIPSISGGSTDTVCLLSLANCVGAGGAVSTIGGTQNFVTKYNNAGATQLTSSEIFDNGSGVSIGNSSVQGLFNVGASNQFQVSSSGAVTAVGVNSGAGLLQGTGGLTVTGGVTFPSLNSAGVLHTNGSGVVSTSAVVLGTDTSGNYVANLGALTGLTAGGNSGAGSTPSLTVTYGALANTAAQGNAALSFTGSGNLTGTVSGTAGGGITSNTLAVVNSPTFSGTLTVQGASVTVGAAAQAGSLILNDGNGASNKTATLQAFATLGQNTIYTLPDPGGATATICLTTGNCAGTGGGIIGSGSSGQIAKFNGTGSITGSTLSESGTTLTASGNVIIQGANSLMVGTALSNNGSIIFKNATNSHTLTLLTGATASDLTFTLPTADGANGSCLETNSSGVLSFQSCTGGAGGGVTSLDLQTGILSLANSSGNSGTITIDNAKADGITKGIATFNATNFTDNGSGVINTVQNIATSSSPVFVSPNATTGINTGVGAGTQRIDASGNLVNIGTITSGLINGQTISSSTNFTGTVALATPGSATNSNYLCYNSSNQIANCNTTGNGTAFVQGGNSFAAQAVLGTNDNNSLAFETNGTNRAILDTSGNLQFQQASTLSTGTGNLTIQANGTSTLGLDTTGAGTVNVGNTNATTINVGTGTASNTITIGNSGNVASVAQTIKIGTNSNAGTTSAITIGNPSTAGSITIQAGTGGLNLGNGGAANTIQIGNTGAANAQTINIGNNTSASGTTTIAIGAVNNLGSTTVQSGSGGLFLGNGGGTGNITIGTTNNSNSQTITLGANINASAATVINIGAIQGTSTTNITSGSGGLNLGTGGIANTIQIGNTTGAVAQTINIGSNNTASSTNNVNIGSTKGGTITLQGATIQEAITGGSDTVQSVTSNSTSAFQIQNAANTTLLAADTTNLQVQIATFSTPTGLSATLLSAPASPSVTTHGTTGATNYSYRVSAVLGTGFVTAISTTASTAAGNATLTGSNYNIVSWSAVAGAVSYNVYRTVAGGTSPTTTGLIANTTGVTINDTGLAVTQSTPSTAALTNSTTYFYEVTAVDAQGGETPASSEVSMASGNSSNQAIGLSWTSVAGARSYRVYRGTSSGGENVYFTSSGNRFTDYNTATSVSATPPTANTAYANSLGNNPNQELTIGSTGSAQGQLYLGSTVWPAATVTNIGANGSTWYKYIIAGVTSSGGLLSQETGGFTNSSNATLSGTNYNAISWTAMPGAASYNIYRTQAGGGIAFVGTSVTNSYNDQTSGQSTTTNPVAPFGTIGNISGLTGFLQDVKGQYAYLEQNATSLEIVNISNPSNPFLVSNTAISGIKAVKVQGRYAYVSTGSILYVYDVSNPAVPVLKATTSLYNSDTIYDMYISGRYLYITSGITATRSSTQVEIFDISYPSSPVLSGVSAGNAGLWDGALAVSGHYLYSAGLVNPGALYVYDISNPANITQVTSTTQGVVTNSQVVGMAISNNKLYLTQLNGSFVVMDISNPAAPYTLGNVNLSFNTSAVIPSGLDNDIALSGEYAYVGVSNNNPGQIDAIATINIANPSSPTFIGYQSVNDGLRMPAGIFVQGRYLITESGWNTYQFKIFDLGGEYAQNFQAGNSEISNLTVDNGLTVGENAAVQGGLSVGNSIQAAGDLGVGGNVFIEGSTSLAGGILGGATINGLATPAAPTVTPTGTAGATNYSYAVAAVSASGGTTPASTATQTTTGNATLTGTNFNQVTWTPVNGAVSYNIYRTASAGTPSSTGLIGNASSTTFNDTGIAGTTAAPTLDSSGQLTVNGIGAITGSLSVGTGLTVSTGGASITGTTTINGSLTVQSASGETIGVAGTTAGTLNIANASNSQLSILQASAPTGSGNATFLLPGLAGSASYTLCTTTTCAASTGSGSYIQNGTSLQANANFNIQSAASGSVGAIIQGASGQSADLLDLKTSTPVTVVSVGATGNTTFENSTNSTAAFQIQNATGAVLLNASTSGSAISINQLLAPGTVTPTLLSAPASPSIVLIGSTGSTSYSYKVAAELSSGYVTAVSAVVTTATGNATETATNHNRITWTAVTGAVGYMIYRTASSGTPSSTGLIGTAQSTTFDDNGFAAGQTTPSASTLSSGTTYFYKVTAVDSQGGETTASSETSQAVSATNQAIGLTWTIVPGARSYRIYRGTSTGAENIFFTTNSNLYVDYGTGASTTATVPTGNTAYSTNLTNSSNAQISIGSNGNTTGQVYVGGNLGAPPTISNGGAPGANRYVYEVAGLNAAGNLLPPPYGVNFTSTGNATLTSSNFNTITWNAIPGATSYNIYRVLASFGSPSTAGFIGTTSALTFNDTGLSASGTVPSSAIGSVTVSGVAATSIASQGRYVYTASGSAGIAFQIVDTSDPTNPQLLSSASGNNATYLAAQGRYVYAANSSTNTIQIFDVSNPTSPVLLSTTGTGFGAITPSTTNSIAVSGRYAYVGITISGGAAYLEVFDISNPAAPNLNGTVAVTSTIRSLVVSGKYVYAGITTNPLKLQSIDVSNPSSPVLVGTYASSVSNENYYGMAVQGNYLYGWINGSGGPLLQIFSINYPASPTLISQTTPDAHGGTNANVEDLVVNGRYAYAVTADNNPGGMNAFEIYDISNPLQPVLISAVSTATSGGSLVVNGRYAYLLSNSTFQSFDLGGEYASNLEAGSAELNGLTVNNAASFGSNVSIQAGLAVGSSIQAASSISAGGSLYVQGATSLAGGILGGVTISGLSTPAAPTVTPTGTVGSTNFSYAVAAVSASGGNTPASTATQTTTGNATLNSTNYNAVSWAPIAGAISYNIYRTASSGTPSSTGLVGNTNATTFNDTGIAGTTAAPTVDTSGQLTVKGYGLFKDTVDSTTAFQIQNAAGTSNLLVADTTNTFLGIGAAPANSLLTIGTNTTTAAGGVIFGTDTSADLYRSAAATLSTDGSFIVGGKLAVTSSGGTWQFFRDTGTGNLFINPTQSAGLAVNFQNSATIIQNSNGSATPYQLLDSSGSHQLFKIDSAGSIYLGAVGTGSSPDVKLSRGGAGTLLLQAQGSNATTLVDKAGSSQSTTDLQEFQNNSGTILSEITSAGSLQGGNGSGSNAAGTDLTIAGGQGTGTGNGGNLNFQIAKPGTTGSSPNPLATVASLAGSNGAALFKNSADSTTGFQIQNAAGTSNLFVADTTNTGAIGIGMLPINSQLLQIANTGIGIYAGTNKIAEISANDGLQVATTGTNAWANLGTNGSSPILNLYNASNVVVGSVSSTGAVLFENATNSTTAYQIQNAAGTSNLFVGDTTNTKLGVAQAPSAGGNALQVTGGITATTGGVLASAGNVNATAGTFQTNGTDRIDNSGNLVNIGNLTSTGSSNFTAGGANGFNFRPGTDNTTAFQIQSAGGSTTLLTADTTNKKLTLGVAGSTPILLVLGNKNTTGDPATEVDGAIYYNSALNQLRCGENTFWADCAISNIQSSYDFRDDFFGGEPVSGGTGFNASKVYGQLNWAMSQTGGGGCTAGYNQGAIGATHDHPGYIRSTTDATSATTACGFTPPGTTGTNQTFRNVLAPDDVFQTSTGVGSTTQGVYRIGWTNTATSAQPTSGAWFEFDSTIDNSHWRYCYANNGAATCASTTSTVTANSWAHLDIHIISSTAITFDIMPSGGSLETHALTSLSVDLGGTNSLSPSFTISATSTSTPIAYVDYIDWRGVVTTAGGR